MKTKILVILLILSILGNMYQAFVIPTSLNIVELQNKTNNIAKENTKLNKQVQQDNISIKGYLSQLEVYRRRLSTIDDNTKSTPSNVSSNIQGYAELQSPAVLQVIQQDPNSPFGRQMIQEGNMINISVEIRPGKGRVLVQTKPLMGTVFQDAANTAVFVAQNKTNIQLDGSDVIFSIESQSESQSEIPSVDGPSAGTLMTLLVISAIEKKNINNNVTLTGTIDQEGHVGAIGGVVEKAQAAKQNGKTLFLLPNENSKFIRYNETSKNIGGITIIEQTPEVLDVKQYIESNIGINIQYVDNIDDVLKDALVEV